MPNEPSQECLKALEVLARAKNVLISGPPGTGKSRLLAEVALAFESGVGVTATEGVPEHNPKDGIPIPPSTTEQAEHIPSVTQSNRKVFRTVFHQNSKYRDFVSGITPAVNKQSGDPDFTIVAGILFRAAEHAMNEDSAALLIIDEINRGPAVQVFGDAIVAMESDKRLADDGSRRSETQYFEMLNPDTGEMTEYALPSHLYILAAMNQADASVEPLDVAFLRRWEPLKLPPSEKVLREYYGLPSSGNDALPSTPGQSTDALEASIRAWESINEQIALGRGDEFQIGHGVLMSESSPSGMELDEVLRFLCVGWAKIRSHVEEVFFGDTRGIAATFNALDGPAFNPFKLIDTTFADDLRHRLDGPSNFSESMIYDSLRSFAREP